jgi:uncharacterized protein (TIGR00369 family)
LTAAAGFQELLGYRTVDWREGTVELALAIGPEHLNTSGTVHGGAIATLLDSAMGRAGCYAAPPARRPKAVTLSLSVTFVGQVATGTLRAIGRRRGGGSNLFMSSGEVFGANGTLVATGEGVYRYRRRGSG